MTELESDGRNTIAWESLAGTVCDGGVACVVIDYEDGTILEADLAFEEDMTRYGFQDFWTTDKTTWFDDVGGRLAISDVGTHEFGHFAGLDHTTSRRRSPCIPSCTTGTRRSASATCSVSSSCTSPRVPRHAKTGAERRPSCV